MNEQISFVEQIKQAGIDIIGEEEVKLRLNETNHWKYSFITLFKFGSRINILFKANKDFNENKLKNVFDKFNFKPNQNEEFKNSLFA